MGQTTITASSIDGSKIVSNPITISVKKKFTVTFNISGATEGSVSPLSVFDGDKITMPSNVLTKTNYSFAGWYQESSCSNPWNFDTDTVTADKTLYAKWTSNKLSQTSPASPKFRSASTNSLTVEAITATDFGDIEYAVSTSTDAPSTGWQTSTTFTGLTAGTDYYFFAKYSGNDYYLPAISSGAKLGLGYSVTYALIGEYCNNKDYGSNSDSDTFITYINGDYDTIGGYSSGLETFKINDDPKSYKTYTFTNVDTISRPDSYITFTTGTNYSTIEFRNYKENDYKYKVEANITVVGTGESECLDENTLVTMADGKQKAMKDIEVGDEVLSIDFDTMKLVARKVIYSSKNEENYKNWNVLSYYKYTFSDGTIIKRAMRHRFYSLEAQSYKHMHTWETGEHAYNQNGTNPTLVSIEIIQEPLHYARITLEVSNNYFANGLATGDSECCPNKVVLNQLLQR